jgi:aminoglycoside 3-N-acetyltransferase
MKARPAEGLPAADRPAATARSLAGDLRRLGLAAGQSVLLHASLRSLGPVDGGAAAVVAAFLDVLGPDGTLVVPAMTMGNSATSRDFARQVRGMNRRQRRDYRLSLPAFDPLTTPSSGMGAIAEQVRTTPGAVRSAHPQSSFAAVGAKANYYMSRHQPECHFGRESPLAALYEDSAVIILLGTSYSACTAFHLAEYLYTKDPPRRGYACMVSRDGKPRWWRYKDVVLDDRDFPLIGADLDKNRYSDTGVVGAAAATRVSLCAAVDFAAAWLAARRFRVIGID